MKKLKELVFKDLQVNVVINEDNGKEYFLLTIYLIGNDPLEIFFLNKEDMWNFNRKFLNELKPILNIPTSQ